LPTLSPLGVEWAFEARTHVSTVPAAAESLSGRTRASLLLPIRHPNDDGYGLRNCERCLRRLTEMMRVALATEMLLVSGVALDLVGAGVLSHAHNAESIVELREDIGEEGSAVGEPDALSTHAQLLAEKRIGFLLLAVGLVLYLTGVVLKSPDGPVVMGLVAGGVVVAGLIVSVIFTRVVGHQIREQARRAREQQDPDALPEQ
jgi:hypothetical protein